MYTAATDGAGCSTSLLCSADHISAAQRTLFSHVCGLTTAVLGVDFNYILLWSPRDNAYVPVAAHNRYGAEPQTTQTWPAARYRGLLAHLRHHDVLTRSAAAQLGCATPDADESIYIALRKDGKLIGVHVATDFGVIDADRAIALVPHVAGLTSQCLESAARIAELERKNAINTKVIAIASHELRDALQTMVVLQTLLLGSPGLSDDQATLVLKLNSSSRGLLELVERVLDLARSEVSHPIEVEELAIGDLIGELAAEVEAQLATTPAINVTWGVADNLPLMSTDRMRLRIVLRNLLQNALKFTQAGTIMLYAYPHGTGIAIDVTDPGAGIDAATRAIMFEPFRRGDNHGNHVTSGSGLGLYIVRQLLDPLGGQIDVRSETGRGTTIRVCLPRSIPSTADHVAADFDSVR